MNALEWLKKKQADSLRNQAIFDAVPFEQTAHGFMARNYKKPEVKNKLVEKRGNATLTKEWVDDSSSIRSQGLDGREGQLVDRLDIQAPRPPQSIREMAGGYARQPETPVPPNAWIDAMRHRTYNPDVYQMRSPTPEAVRSSEGPSMEVLPGESIEEAQLRIFGRGSPESAPRETWGGKYNLTMPQHPVTRRWIQDPSTILNMGNLIKKMGRTFQGVDDRLERNRVRRLMEHRTTNPYYRRGLY